MCSLLRCSVQGRTHQIVSNFTTKFPTLPAGLAALTAKPVRPLSTSQALKMPSAEGGHPHVQDTNGMSDEEKESWKSRAPYIVHEAKENFDAKWKGSCHCGKVKYQLNRDKPLVAKYCHCTTCQRLHGGSNTIFRVSGVDWH